MRDDAWLNELKIGDEVAIAGSGMSGREYRIQKVVRITKTMIILDDDDRYRKDGRRVSRDSWNHRWLVPVSQEVLDKVEYEKLRWKTIDKLDKLTKLLNHRKLTLHEVRHYNSLIAQIILPNTEESAKVSV